jgi:ankyrin repeat protein
MLLIDAAINGKDDAVADLLGKGADKDAVDSRGRTALYCGCWKDHKFVVKHLLQAGANVEKANAETGVTPLILAAANGRLNVMELLLQNGADATKRENTGRTAFDAARKYTKHSAVKMLEVSAPLSCVCY